MKFEKLYGRSPFFLSYCSFTAHHAKGNRHAICVPRSNMEGRLGLSRRFPHCGRVTTGYPRGKKRLGRNDSDNRPAKGGLTSRGQL